MHEEDAAVPLELGLGREANMAAAERLHLHAQDLGVLVDIKLWALADRRVAERPLGPETPRPLAHRAVRGRRNRLLQGAGEPARLGRPGQLPREHPPRDGPPRPPRGVDGRGVARDETGAGRGREMAAAARRRRSVSYY